MTSSRVRLIMRTALFATLVTLAGAEAVVYAAQTGDGGGQTQKRPWLMISLAPGEAMRPGSSAVSVIKRFSGNNEGVIRHFSQVNRELVAQIDPEFVVLSPQSTPWCRYSGSTGVALQNFLWLLPILAEEMNIPILGICGGHQALALAFGGRVGPVRGLGYECMPYSKNRQQGVVKLTVTSPDPIFRGIQDDLHIVASHYDEVKVLPPGFVLLASERLSPNQIMRHPALPVYGIQGHPERFKSDHPDGAVLIRNFLKIAVTFNQAVRGFSSPLPWLLSFHRSRGSSF